MTKDEFKETLKELAKKQVEAYSAYLKAKRDVIECKKTYAYEIVKHFEDKIGKKVVIHYKDYMGEEKNSKPGFLKEFRWYSNNTFVEDGLYPVLTKPKQDGSMSNREFPEYDNTRAEITRIVGIEEVLYKKVC